VRRFYKVNKLKGEAMGRAILLFFNIRDLKKQRKLVGWFRMLPSQIQGDILERISPKERVIGKERARGYDDCLSIISLRNKVSDCKRTSI
jgi:hypothetical protein